MDSQGIIKSVFNVPRALIGVLHVGALPGTPESRHSVAQIAETAVTEARVYAAAGFHGLIMENTHDRPYLKGSVGPEIVAAMAAIGVEIRRAVALLLGVQILAGANLAAMAVAHACSAAFVRVEGLVFAHVADEGIIESSAGELLRYRRAIGRIKCGSSPISRRSTRRMPSPRTWIWLRRPRPRSSSWLMA
jgi:membrane complex biogenesis BtpA family protein